MFLQLSFHTALKSVYTDSLTNEDSEGEIAAVKSLIYQELQGITWTFQGKFVQICWNFQGIYQVSQQVMAGTLICDKPEIKTKTYTHNQWQNELRRFALNWAFLLTHPLHAVLCRCSSYLQKTTNTATLNGGGGYMGGVWILLFSEGTIFEYKVSIILSPIVAPSWYKNAAKPAWEQAMNKTESSMQRKSFPIAWGLWMLLLD